MIAIDFHVTRRWKVYANMLLNSSVRKFALIRSLARLASARSDPARLRDSKSIGKSRHFSAGPATKVFDWFIHESKSPVQRGASKATRRFQDCSGRVFGSRLKIQQEDKNRLVERPFSLLEVG